MVGRTCPAASWGPSKGRCLYVWSTLSGLASSGDSDLVSCSLLGKTKVEAGEALVEVIGQIEKGTATRRPNRDEDSTYFSFATWKDAELFRSRGLRMF